MDKDRTAEVDCIHCATKMMMEVKVRHTAECPSCGDHIEVDERARVVNKVRQSDKKGD